MIYKVKKTKRELREMFQGYAFIAPAVLVLLVFTIISVIFSVYLSFNKVDLFTGKYTWNSFSNYISIFKDPRSLIALKNTALFAAIVVPVQTVISLVMAYVLASRDVKGKKAFRLIYFLPTLTSSSALTIIFMFLFNINGPINNFLIGLGLYHTPINFLQEPQYALKVIMAMNIWSTVPYFMTIYLASLVDLPYSLYEAAEIDGASSFEKLRFITIPYLRPITTYVLLTGIIGTFQMFDQAYIFSNGSGGPNNSTLTLSLLIYQNAFGQMPTMGFAAALAVVLALIIFVVSRIAEKLSGGK